MKEIFDAIRQQLSGFKTRCNELLKGLPPIEQVEASQELAWGLRNLHSTLKYQEEQCVNIEAKLSEYENKLKAEVETTVETRLAEKLTAGEYVTKDQATAAATSAADARETTVRNEIQLITTRRKELCTAVDDKTPAILSAEAVSLLPDSLLKGETYKADAVKVADRLKALSDLGVTTGGLVATAARLSVDAAGDTQFADQLSGVRQVADAVKGEKKPGNPAPAPAPFAGGNTDKQTPTVFI